MYQPFVMTMMSCRYQYCMPSVMNNVLFNGTHANDNNTTTSSSSLTDAVAVASPWVRRVTPHPVNYYYDSSVVATAAGQCWCFCSSSL